MFYIVEWTT